MCEGWAEAALWVLDPAEMLYTENTRALSAQREPSGMGDPPASPTINQDAQRICPPEAGVGLVGAMYRAMVTMLACSAWPFCSTGVLHCTPRGCLQQGGDTPKRCLQHGRDTPRRQFLSQQPQGCRLHVHIPKPRASIIRSMRGALFLCQFIRSSCENWWEVYCTQSVPVVE